jgi:hypothetical protein
LVKAVREKSSRSQCDTADAMSLMPLIFNVMMSCWYDARPRPRPQPQPQPRPF